MTADTAEWKVGAPVRRLNRWAARVGVSNLLAALLTLAACLSGVATYAALTESPPFGNDPDTITLLLTLDLVLLLALGGVIARRIVALWVERRRGLAGSRLHVRLVALFSLVAVTPAILVAIFSGVFLSIGIQSWFSERVRTAIDQSVAVAEAYVQEHRQTIRASVLAMANDLNRNAPLLSSDPQLFQSVVATQAAVRGLTEAMVFEAGEPNAMRRVLARGGLTFLMELDPIAPEDLERARQGDVVLLTEDSDDRVRALIRLDRYFNSFLFVGRLVEPTILSHLERVQGAAEEYRQTAAVQTKVQLTFGAIFVVVALVILLAAVWVGLMIANQIATPISHLIAAAEQVRAGDLTARVVVETPPDEISTLGRAFNRMTSQLESQRADLIEANRQLDLRRRFTEAVLSGVSAGVVGLDQDGFINLPNRSAVELLEVDAPERLVGRLMTDLIPDLAEPLAVARRRPGKLTEVQVQSKRRNGSPRSLLVRVTAESVGNEIKGFVVTFDDISELLSAQRKAAWADIARRIAHEIKNPLTPIQLSAERLKRKYLKEIVTDPEIFTTCTDTIIRQVDDIGRMVDEFSAFARMPQPMMRPTVIDDLVRQVVFLQAGANPRVTVTVELPDTPTDLVCDARLVAQALTNLVKNAVEAIDAQEGAAGPMPGRITVRVAATPETVAISVEDNGVGLPSENRHRLTEPYVTTRSKGTGLGLAIVRKIMEDHDGGLELADRPHDDFGGGAIVTLLFPRLTLALGANPEPVRQSTHGA